MISSATSIWGHGGHDQFGDFDMLSRRSRSVRRLRYGVTEVTISSETSIWGHGGHDQFGDFDMGSRRSRSVRRLRYGVTEVTINCVLLKAV
ncbi:hypothetical protein BgiBS90_026165 [Biomphalaria glabrata]|nr:hypothetical protein BgiBS90_026165 [Biomphalaria glabrata]